MTLYRHILGRAWHNTWHSKYLWFFGLFVMLLGNGGEYEVIVRAMRGEADINFFAGFKGLMTNPLFSLEGISNMGHRFITEPFSALLSLLVLLLVLAIICFLVWMAIISQAAIVNNTALSIGQKKHDLGKGIAAGLKYFWPVLSFNFLIKLVIFAGLFIVTWPLLMVVGKASFLLNGILFIVLIPLAMSVAFILKYAIAYTVIRKYNFSKALKSGWLLFKNNWLVTLEMGFILFFITIFIGLLMFLVFLVLSTPFILFLLLFKQLVFASAFWTLLFFALIMLLLMVMFAGMLLATFQTSAWTVLFVELESKGGVSKIVRFFNNK